MASAVEEEGKKYASTDREESSEEQREPAAVYNVSTAIQKYALKAMDMLQLEIQRVKEETIESSIIILNSFNGNFYFSYPARNNNPVRIFVMQYKTLQRLKY